MLRPNSTSLPSISSTLALAAEEWSVTALACEQKGLALLEQAASAEADSTQQAEVAFAAAFDALAEIASMAHWNLEQSTSFPAAAEERFRHGLPDGVVRNDLLLAYRLAASGLLGDRLDAMRLELKKVDGIRAFHFGDFVLRAFVALTEREPRPSYFGDLQRGFVNLRGKPWIDAAHGGNAIVGGFDHLMEMASGAFQSRAGSHTTGDRFTSYIRDHHRRARAAFEGAPAREMFTHLSDLMYFGSIRIALRPRLPI